jgi:hypothetical protein
MRAATIGSTRSSYVTPLHWNSDREHPPVGWQRLVRGGRTRLLSAFSNRPRTKPCEKVAYS